jgi:hypothetical protein
MWAGGQTDMAKLTGAFLETFSWAYLVTGLFIIKINRVYSTDEIILHTTLRQSRTPASQQEARDRTNSLHVKKSQSDKFVYDTRRLFRQVPTG